MDDTRDLKSIPDDELLRRLAELLGQSRRVEADLVAHIAEVDERRLYAREASPSMFAYCTEVLHLSEAEAYLRIAAARASREHPMLLAMLADGRLHLTAVAKLAPHLTVENREALLTRATHKSKRRIEELVAELAPRPDAPALIRKLPEGRVETRAALLSRNPVSANRGFELEGAATPSGQPGDEMVTVGSGLGLDALQRPALELGPEGTGAAGDRLRPDGVLMAGAQLRPDGVVSPSQARAHGHTPVGASGRVRTVVIEPLAPGRYKVQFTASAALRDKLVRLRALMRSSVSDGDLAAIIEEAVTEKLERLEARRLARTKEPRETPRGSATSPRTRHVPAAVKRAVYERDGGRCRYADTHGRRCTARDRLEFHHRRPFGYGGEHSTENVALACRAHNSYLAEVDYGREAMAGKRRSTTASGRLVLPT